MNCKKSEVINNFLHDNGESKTPNGSLYFLEREENSVLFSYGEHFPLCVKFENGDLLINSNSYSATTSQQKGDLSRALGFTDFKDLVKAKREYIKLLDTNELKEIVRGKFKTYAEYIEDKI